MSSGADTVRDATAEPRVRRQRLGLPFHVVEPVVAVADAAIIVGANVVGGAAYQLAVNSMMGDVAPYAGYGLIGSLAYALAAHQWQLYHLQVLLQRRRDYLKVVAGWLWAVLVVSIVLFLMKRGSEVSRGSIISSSVLASLVLLSWRAKVKDWLRRHRPGTLGRAPWRPDDALRS
jgi:undecaprenyl-phosphate galactose phosphotransferase/putative colanic acid biosynthesis UDP-glucose lipid carrier transferase